MLRTHLIYVPGLGDGYSPLRRLALHFWKARRGELTVSFVPMYWSKKNDTYEDKIRRIEQEVRRHPQKDSIALMGESAGGAVVLGYGLKNERVHTIVTLCGKNRGIGNVGTRLYRKHPSLRTALENAEAATSNSAKSERLRVLTVYSSLDGTVRPKDAVLEDALAIDLRTPGHLYSIAIGLTRRKGQLIDAILSKA